MEENRSYGYPQISHLRDTIVVEIEEKIKNLLFDILTPFILMTAYDLLIDVNIEGNLTKLSKQFDPKKLIK